MLRRFLSIIRGYNDKLLAVRQGSNTPIATIPPGSYLPHDLAAAMTKADPYGGVYTYDDERCFFIYSFEGWAKLWSAPKRKPRDKDGGE